MDENTQVQYEQEAASYAFCIHCGTKIAANSTFCNKCGRRQDAAPAAPAYTPTYAPVYAPAQPRLDIPSGIPVGAIVMASISALFFFIIMSMNEASFTWQLFLMLSIYAGMITSCILHRKNLYIIAGICWALLAVTEMWNMIEVIGEMSSTKYLMEALFEEFDLQAWQFVLLPECYALIALGFIFGGKNAGSGLRIAGAITLLCAHILPNLYYLMEYREYVDEEYVAQILFLQTPWVLFLCLSVLLAKPALKQKEQVQA